MHSFLSNEPSTLIKNQNAKKKIQCPIQKTSSKHEIMETGRLSGKLSNVQECLKSTNEKQGAIIKEDTVCNKVTPAENSN